MNPSKFLETYSDYVVILGNGEFPTHPVPLDLLRQTPVVVCCDGAVSGLLSFGREPDFIVGDMDSISPELLTRFEGKTFRSDDQETNDQTKALLFCLDRGWSNIRILGSTGFREDHSLGNMALLSDYLEMGAEAIMITDHGMFIPINRSSSFTSVPGQQISLFSLTPQVPVTTAGLKYPLDHRPLLSWWQGTLNEALGEEFALSFSEGRFLVFFRF